MRLPLLLAISVISAANAEQNVARPKPAIERAIEAFKRQTRDLGLRAAGVGEQSGRNSFRNDYLDAVPYEVRQRGKDKSVLRRNQFGFSVAGPVVVPGLVHRGSGTYFTLNYEGVRENIARTNLYTIPTLAVPMRKSRTR